MYKNLVTIIGVVATITIVLAGPSLGRQTSGTAHTADSLGAVFETPVEVPSLGPDPDLGDYLAYAAHENPSLKAAFYEWKSLVQKSDYAGALPDPTISYGYFIRSVETRVGPQNQRVSLRQAFPWFGTLGASEEMTSQAARSAYQKFEAEKLRLFYRVTAAYYEYYFLGRELAITRDNLELLTFWESVVRAKYRVALRQHPDVIKAQVELGKLEDRIASLEDRLEPAATQLRVILNLPDSVYLPVPSEIYVEETAVDSDTIFAVALRNNPNLKSVAHLIDKEKAGRRLAGKMAMPSFSVGVDYIDTGPAINPMLEDSGKDAWIVSASLSLPLWFGKNSARKQEAEARYRKAQYNYASAKNDLRAVTEDIVYEYDDALRRVRLYRDGLVPKAEEALNASYAAYQTGEVDFLSLLDAQRQLLDFQLMAERARSDLAIRRASIEMITAVEFETMQTE